ncbi:unnamed protein product [Plutella xylostella]|uniref:(diamondback moth) hypothetical protein n=1 Tax=Plutella xylostella TaxID=51655 RepID=A0A8S4DDR2_PLUXY|nr:unnamed protein product [Plutella xylostella]
MDNHELQYGALLEGCGAELPSLSACAPPPPHLDPRRRKEPRDVAPLPPVNIHLHALFAAVEHGYLDKARNILESTDVDVNSLNSDGLSPLDVAVLANNRQLAKMLMEFGAKEGTQCLLGTATLSLSLRIPIHRLFGYVVRISSEGVANPVPLASLDLLVDQGIVAPFSQLVVGDFIGPVYSEYASKASVHEDLKLVRDGFVKTPEAIGCHLRRLAREAEARLHEVAGPPADRDCTRSSAGGGAATGTTGCAGGAGSERDKQALHWERRVRTLKRLLLGYQQARVPPAPPPPELEVCGSHAVTVRLRDLRHFMPVVKDPPIITNSSPQLEVCGSHAVTVRLRDLRHFMPVVKDPPIITKYRVEWSSRGDFSNICGTREVASSGATTGTKLMAAGLTRGRRYFFRACAGNVKGWGGFTASTPRSVVPSSWRDVSTRTFRGDSGGAAAALESLATAAAGARQRPPAQPPRLPRKKTATIRQLFTAASKFQKNLRRGVYLACILYHEDKVLVTSEEFLPVIEVDETYPTCIYTDFHWLMKVACSWDEVKSLRSDMEKHTSSSIHFRLKLLTAAAQMQSALCVQDLDQETVTKVLKTCNEVKSLRSDMEKHTSSSIHFRLKLLTAAAQMQSALCVQDLGQLFHKPLRDSHGTVVLSCVNSVKSVKSVSALNSRWAPVAKLRRRVLSEDNTISELLMASVHEQIAYHQVSRIQLPRGLYLGYLKLQSSVEVVRIVAPARSPNVPPHTRVRDNPHVSAEEWEYLKSQPGGGQQEENTSTSLVSICTNQERLPSESQAMFLEQVAGASRRLFKDMEINNESAATHRIYDLEVIELSGDVSFIMVCPPAELACSVPGQKEILLQRGDLLSLPIQAFEMIHLQTYHTNILNKYSKLSCVLELDVALAAHSHREAFSCTELQTAKERLTKLEDLQNNLNTVWKAERWLMDLISFARDKDKTVSSAGILLKHILDKTPLQACLDGVDTPGNEKDVSFKVDFLQIPSRDGKITKTSPGRGSWPGPAGNGNHANLHPEFSKSEQHLSLAPRQTSVSTLNLSGSQYLGTESKHSRKNSADSQYTQSSAISNNYLSSNSQFDIKSSGSHNSISSRLPPSRSEDTLVLQNENMEPKARPHSINTSMSTTSSPLLTVKGYYPGSMISVRGKGNVTSESAQSLSSDSESQSCPINANTVPVKNRPQSKHPHRTFVASKSMTNVKSSEADFVDAGQELFAKPASTVKRQPLAETHEDAEYSNKVPKTDERMMKSDSEDSSTTKADTVRLADQPGILQVFAAYETGLASGTSLKLHVTPRTSAREVIDLVVKQLNMAAVLKGKSGPVYGPEKLQDFCLVAVIGARERCLRDDFRPLQLQNPWRKGRLYVRLKHDVLAALQHSAKQPAYI